jgi:hypothetical protein
MQVVGVTFLAEALNPNSAAFNLNLPSGSWGFSQCFNTYEVWLSAGEYQSIAATVLAEFNQEVIPSIVSACMGWHLKLTAEELRSFASVPTKSPDISSWYQLVQASRSFSSKAANGWAPPFNTTSMRSLLSLLERCFSRFFYAVNFCLEAAASIGPRIELLASPIT